MSKAKQVYSDNGVEISKTSLSEGDEVTLIYSGLLAKCGANEVYAHIGYGDEWQDKAYVPMQRSEDGFKAQIKINRADKLNIAFKDSGENWDNNSASNYSFKVLNKALKSAVKAAEASEAVEKKASSKTATSKKSTSEKSVSASKTTTKKTSTKNK